HLPAQQAGAVYRQFLAQLRQLTHAAGVSLYIDGGNSTERALLLHSGGTEAVPEFESLERAHATTYALLGPGGGDGASTLQVYSSEADDSCLLRIGIWLEADQQAINTERRNQAPTEPTADRAIWIGLRYDAGHVPEEIAGLTPPGPNAPVSAGEWLAHSLLTSANMVWEANQLSQLLRDPTSHLPGRAEFQAHLRDAMDAARNNHPLGLLLINPDDFDLVNRRLDRDSGDAALAEIATRICDTLRHSDEVFRYGGAVFAVQMPGAGLEETQEVAEKLLDAVTGAYLDGAMRLTFSIGIGLYTPGVQEDTDLDDLGLVRRADASLNAAKGKGGDCVMVWQAGDESLEVLGRDRLSGIFTADAEKDYRNMLVLWDTIAMVSSASDEERIAAGFVERIQLAMRGAWVALYTRREGGDEVLLAESGRSSAGPDGEAPEEVSKLMERARSVQRAERLQRPPRPSDEAGAGDRLGYAIPLLADGRVMACLYIEGPESELIVDSSDLVFLNGLAGQVALALDRADLAARWQAEKERESRRLRSEVHGLRQAVQSARLVYTSRQMDALLETARAAAPTDVTVLINGESGTGKEMLARSVHELSNRKGKPFVTVDCGAIAANLMEAELFGHSKGAYTGADKASLGRIVQADGGTLFLDEIGEVPLDVQAKLLRFVQEKEIHPVGAATSRKVDVRIIAATNRDLAREAAAGRFREDLYYRLNVVTLTAPPLRERPDDILPLAGHFLEKFALQYEKGPRRFSQAAERLLQSYSWPGNVRELQNGILRAVVLSADEVIEASQLVFEEPSEPAATPAPAPAMREAQVSANSYDQPTAEPATGDEPWGLLAGELEKQVDAALQGDATATAPLGRWLSEDLVLKVDEIARGTARRGARRLGVAETTYRRQLEKARRLEAQGLLVRSDAWSRLQPTIDLLADSLAEDNPTNVIEEARTQLLEAVVARVGEDAARGSALMGITVPTYRRWTEQAR
ncbi:MAG: sigma 54-interacting transcriptional regulator, partial [Halieaceae bacterium]|nr:sigma 54-interacting transcriptional regulator [Halieaceae bacterium]